MCVYLREIHRWNGAWFDATKNRQLHQGDGIASEKEPGEIPIGMILFGRFEFPLNLGKYDQKLLFLDPVQAIQAILEDSVTPKAVNYSRGVIVCACIASD